MAWGLGGVGWGNTVHVACNNVHYTNAPTMKTPEIWEWLQLPSLESLLLRARRVFVPLVLWHVCSRHIKMVAKASWWQMVPHVTLNSPVNIIWAMKLAIIGGVDGMWKISKGAVPSSWSTRKNGTVNPQLLQEIRIWQRRWHHGNSKDYMSLTGHASGYDRSKKRPSPQGHKTL